MNFEWIFKKKKVEQKVVICCCIISRWNGKIDDNRLKSMQVIINLIFFFFLTRIDRDGKIIFSRSTDEKYIHIASLRRFH